MKNQDSQNAIQILGLLCLYMDRQENLNDEIWPEYELCSVIIVYACLPLFTRLIAPAESQKGIVAVQRCSVENQKGTITIDFVQQ